MEKVFKKFIFKKEVNIRLQIILKMLKECRF